MGPPYLWEKFLKQHKVQSSKNSLIEGEIFLHVFDFKKTKDTAS